MNAPERTPNTASDGQEVAASGPELVELVRTVLQHQTAFTFRITGASMWPFLRDRDLVTVSPVRGEVRIGDVVAVVHPGAEALLVHRIVGCTGTWYLIKGDATAQPDGLVSTERILGHVTRIQRAGQEVRFGLAISLPNALLPLYYLLRPIRLMTKHGLGFGGPTPNSMSERGFPPAQRH